MTAGSSRLRILHIDTGMELRGGQQQILLLARGLRLRGHAQLIACPEGSVLETLARKENFSTFPFPAHDPGHAHGILDLRQTLRAQPFAVIHAHDGKGQTLSWLASIGLPVRRAASRRVTFLPARRFDFRLKYGRTCDAVIAVSNFVRQLLMDSGVPESKILVIPDGVEIPESLPGPQARANARRKLGYKSHHFLAGHLGSASREKGYEAAGDAAAILQTSFAEAQILWAVHPSDRHPLTIQADNFRTLRLGLSLLDFFTALDLYVMPSLVEGLGSSALLAMAHGLPVIASRVGGLPEIVEEGKTGWLVPAGSPAELAQAIRSAAALGPPALRQMGEAGRQQARRFASDIMVERTESLYLNLLSGQRAG